MPPVPIPIALLLALIAYPALAQVPFGQAPSGLAPSGLAPSGLAPSGGGLAAGRTDNATITSQSLPQPVPDQSIVAPPDDAVATRLPEPPLDDNAATRDFLIAARGALAAGRSGEAQEALERAETRALDRSVPLFRTADPIRDKLIAQIEQVLRSLATGDRLEAMRLLKQALAATDDPG